MVLIIVLNTTDLLPNHILLFSNICDTLLIESMVIVIEDVPYRKKLDDLLDALCHAVVAKLGIRNGFCTIPEAPYTDRTGLKMQIVTSKV